MAPTTEVGEAGEEGKAKEEGEASSEANEAENTEETVEVVERPKEILYTFRAEFGSIPMDREDNYFVPYLSTYAKGFPLKNTMIIPRPCAFKSYNLKPVSYYRG